ncbi:MAG: LysR family transcriptional regulator [Methylobacteriaceae bacterium]|nr:LysR family transcriptional regulator [Methylobacteriaceae bacterium]
MGAAARHLNLTQPAVTRRIQEMERELGGKLMRRQGRNVVPTDLGARCLAGAERILSEIAAMRVAASGQAAVGSIRMGLVESIALTWFESFLFRIEARYPNVRFDIDVDLSERLVTKLQRREIDIAMLPGPVRIPGVIRAALGKCPLKWLGSVRFRPAERALTVKELADLPIIGLPQDADAQRSMTRWFEEAGVSPKRVHCCNSFSVVSLLVRRGIGVSLMPPDLFARDMEDGTLSVMIDDAAALTVNYSAAFLPDVHLAILPEIVALAQEESWFLGDPRSASNGFTMSGFLGASGRHTLAH